MQQTNIDKITFGPLWRAQWIFIDGIFWEGDVASIDYKLAAIVDRKHCGTHQPTNMADFLWQLRDHCAHSVVARVKDLHSLGQGWTASASNIDATVTAFGTGTAMMVNL